MIYYVWLFDKSRIRTRLFYNSSKLNTPTKTRLRGVPSDKNPSARFKLRTSANTRPMTRTANAVGPFLLDNTASVTKKKKNLSRLSDFAMSFASRTKTKDIKIKKKKEQVFGSARQFSSAPYERTKNCRVSSSRH